MARDGGTIQIEIDEIAAGDTLAIDAPGARNLANDRLELLPDRFDLFEVGAEDLDADRRTDAGREHVDAIANRDRPGVRMGGNLELLVHVVDQVLPRHPVRPERANEGL